MGVFAVVLLSWSTSAVADETDNFTCRLRPLAESQDVLDTWVNDALHDGVAAANRSFPNSCRGPCLVRILQRAIGRSIPHPLTLVPQSRLAWWAGTQAVIDRCHLAFRDSIYGAEPYDQPLLFPFTGRVIFLADSIRLSGRIVGLDKINHFIREGFEHWREVERGRGIAQVLEQERGAPQRPLLMTEHGLKGLSLTGVVSYADLAAGYSGFRFWRDLLSSGLDSSFVREDASGRFAIQRRFRFADYVNDAWDETINPSSFHPALGRQVAAALRERHVAAASYCRALMQLPDAELYVNPSCLGN